MSFLNGIIVISNKETKRETNNEDTKSENRNASLMGDI